MLYYRYRPCGELTFKELRYNELFFATSAENNDPYDGKVFLSYEFDKEKWKRALEVAWQKVTGGEALTALITSLSSYIADKCPTTYEEVMTFDYQQAIESMAPTIDNMTAYNLSQIVRDFIQLYRPRSRYTVSFSRVNNDPLMWSHYASSHKGLILVFRAIDGALYQDKERATKSIERKTPGGLAQSTGYGIPECFHFQDVIYCPDIELIDAARFMPSHVFGRELLDEDERIRYAVENDMKCLEKHECWDYEKETRILLDSPIPWLFGDHFEYSKEERLLYYQPNQLVGVILGALMTDSDKERIRHIITQSRERLSRNCRGARFNFVLSEASISDKCRDVVVKPKEIFGLGMHVNESSPKFAEMIKEWEEGWALVFDDKGGMERKIVT